MTFTPDPERWSSRAPGGSSAEDHFGEALRAAAAATLAPAVPPPRRRLTPTSGRRPGHVAAFTVIAVAGGAVWAMKTQHDPARLPPSPPPAAVSAGHAAIEMAPAAAPAPAVLPVPAAALAPPAPAARSKATPAADEASLLWSAFHQLRAKHDPRAALRALDRHRRLFPASGLHDEAAVARAEALAQLGRFAEAEKVLANLPPHLAEAVRQRLGHGP